MLNPSSDNAFFLTTALKAFFKMTYEPLRPIKHIAYDAINTGDSRKYEKALRDILFYIAREEENFNLRLGYYNQLAGQK